jgi:hypothetical protein
MFRRLRELLVRQVPESLSVCEFECPLDRCTIRTWKSCKLRLRDQQDGNRDVTFSVVNMTGLPASKEQPVELDLVKYRQRVKLRR